MDEIEALNEEWEKIKSSRCSEGLRRGHCNTSCDVDTTSSRPRKKRSRWSDEKVDVELTSDGSNQGSVHANQGPSSSESIGVPKPEQERAFLRDVPEEKFLRPKSESEESDSRESVGRVFEAENSKTAKSTPLPKVFCRPSFNSSDDDDHDVAFNSQSERYVSKRQRKYRSKRSNSSGSDSEPENPIFRWSNPLKRESLESLETKSEENNSISDDASVSVGPFLEKKLTVVVKNLTDWITPSHILQDLKNAQLRNFIKSGIVRKRERGSPYRYAYVDFGTITSARRWIAIRKGRIVVGTQQFEMELTLRDWECRECKVMNFGKTLVCHQCRKPKKSVVVDS